LKKDLLLSEVGVPFFPSLESRISLQPLCNVNTRGLKHRTAKGGLDQVSTALASVDRNFSEILAATASAVANTAL